METSPRRRSRTAASAVATCFAPRTSSPWACSPGCSHRPLETTIDWVRRSSSRKPEVAAANVAAFKSGYNFGVHHRGDEDHIRGLPRSLRPGTYTNVTGNTALAWGLIAAAQLSRPPLVLRLLPDHPCLGHPPRAARCTRTSGCARSRPRTRSPPSARPSAPPSPGTSAVTGSSGPGLALKSEAHLARRHDRVAHDRHRRPARPGPRPGCRPSPSSPTCCSRLYGRHGESPLPVMAIATPSDAFELPSRRSGSR